MMLMQTKTKKKRNKNKVEKTAIQNHNITNMTHNIM